MLLAVQLTAMKKMCPINTNSKKTQATEATFKSQFVWKRIEGSKAPYTKQQHTGHTSKQFLWVFFSQSFAIFFALNTMSLSSFVLSPSTKMICSIISKYRNNYIGSKWTFHVVVVITTQMPADQLLCQCQMKIVNCIVPLLLTVFFIKNKSVIEQNLKNKPK